MNLLSLTGALLTASASVLNHPIKEHSNKKMEDVQYKYQTNEISSNSDLVVGNFYQLSWNCIVDSNGDSVSLEIFDNGDSGTNIIQIVELITNNYNYQNSGILNSFDFGKIYTHVLAQNNTWTEICFFDDSIDDITGTLYAYPVNNSDYTLIFKYLSDVSGFVSSAFSSNLISKVSDEYNSLEPSTTHRGNLYTTIYDFFYGIFDTSDTNEFSSTILGQEVNLTSWLAHTVTIVLLLLGVLWLILVIRWIFRVFSGLIKV